MKFRCASTHPEDLASGRVVAPGEFVEMPKDEYTDPYNLSKLAEGAFIGVSSKGEEVIREALADLEKQEQAQRDETQDQLSTVGDSPGTTEGGNG